MNPTTVARGSVWDKPCRVASWSMLACAISVVCFANAVLAEKPQKHEYRTKAEFLYNFAKLVEWPTNTFANASAPLAIGVVGDESFESLVREVVMGKKVGGRKLTVHQCTDAAGAMGCQILFIHLFAEDREVDFIQGLAGRSVLIVGETDKFLERGGMIRFVQVEGNVRFEVLLDAAEKAGLHISSKLLLLARPVYRPPSTKEAD